MPNTFLHHIHACGRLKQGTLTHFLGTPTFFTTFCSPSQIILCSYAQIDENDHSSFYNPLDNNILKVDHTKGKVTDVEENTSVEFSEKQLSQCKHLQEEISKYVTKTYNSGLVTVYPQRDNGNKFVCAITASKFNEKNFWSGRWRGVYSIEFSDDNTAELSGSMKVNVHYYEDGNVQLNTSRDHLSTCKGSDIAAEIVKAMDACESSFQGHIDETCMNMSDVFKRLRRKLPFTGKLFDFETGAQKMLIS